MQYTQDNPGYVAPRRPPVPMVAPPGAAQQTVQQQQAKPPADPIGRYLGAPQQQQQSRIIPLPKTEGASSGYDPVMRMLSSVQPGGFQPPDAVVGNSNQGGQFQAPAAAPPPAGNQGDNNPGDQGGGGGGGDPFANDPIIMELLARNADQLAKARASARSQEEQLLTRFGDRGLAEKILGKDYPGLGAFLDVNDPANSSTLGRLEHDYKLGLTDLSNATGPDNTFYSGHHAQDMSESARKHTLDVADQTAGVQSKIQGIQDALAQAEASGNMDLIAALLQELAGLAAGATGDGGAGTSESGQHTLELPGNGQIRVNAAGDFTPADPFAPLGQADPGAVAAALRFPAPKSSSSGRTAAVNRSKQVLPQTKTKPAAAAVIPKTKKKKK